MRLLKPGLVDANADEAKWRPLRVSCIVQEPVITYGHGLDLDGPLSWGAYQLYQDAGSPDGELDPRALHLSDWVEDFDLPLARWEWQVSPGDEVDARLLSRSGRLWGWCCSSVIAEWAIEGKMEVRKHPATSAMASLTDSPSFHPGLGTGKAYDLPHPARFPVGATLGWYALGDPDLMRRLLMEVPALGKKVNQGNGRILVDADGLPRWTVEVIDEEGARDWWLMRQGRQMRPMPAAFDASRRAGRGTLRAPRWHDSRRVQVVQGGSYEP